MFIKAARQLRVTVQQRSLGTHLTSGSETCSSSLQKALPSLKRNFDLATSHSSDGTFPLLTQQQIDLFSKKYDWRSDRCRQASVLVLLCSIDDSISVLFTRRAAHLNLHASEISFPGGHYQPETDKSLIDTALRETQEELLPQPQTLLQNIVVLGQATAVPSLKGTPVTPVLACLSDFELDSAAFSHIFPGDPSEVETVFAVSVEELLERERSECLPENRFGMTLAPVFATEYGKIWGLTALILRPLLHRWLRPSLKAIEMIDGRRE